MKTISDFLAEPILSEVEISNRDLRRIVDQIREPLLNANRDDPVLFKHGDRCVWFEHGSDGSPLLQELTIDRLRHVLARRFSWFRVDRRGNSLVTSPPIDVVRDFLASPNITFPPLERITSVPVFAPDGTVPLKPGYHDKTRAILLPSESLDFLADSDDSDDEAVQAALSLFDEVVCDFPFVAHGRTHALAAMLVPFVRAMIKGPTPLHLIEKPEPGSGATLLAQVICDISVGHSTPALTESGSEDEFSRKIHSKLRSGPAVILLDNLRNRLVSAALAAALTNDSLEERIVQHSVTEAAPVRCLWLATANNPSLSREMARRTVPIRLKPETPKPYLRTDFRHANLRDWVALNRSFLVWAMLAMVRKWISVGCPKGQERLGMFESYSQVIGGILQVLGIPGFLATREELSELADDDANELSPLIPKWRDRFDSSPVGVAQLLSLCNEIPSLQWTDGNAHIRLGKLIRANRDRAFGEVTVASAGESRGSKLWRLVPIKPRMVPQPPEEILCHSEGVEGVGECLSPSGKSVE
jgi:hypothetical protein